MRQIFLVPALIGLQFALGSMAGAQDIQSTYEGTFDLGLGVTGIIKLFADLKSSSMRADLTIPPSDGTLSPEHFTPSGLISKDAPRVYELTQGTAYSPELKGTRTTHSRPSRSPYILLTGSFWDHSSGGDTSGSFTANFCVPDTHCSEMISVAGTFAASASSAKREIP